MTDRYLEFTQSPSGRRIAGWAGVSPPPLLRRSRGPVAAQPFAGRAVLIGGMPAARHSGALIAALHAAGAELHVAPEQPGLPPIKLAANAAGVALSGEPPAGERPMPDLCVFDASGVTSVGELRALYDFFQARVRKLPRNARILLIGDGDDDRTGSVTPTAVAASTALRGFMRSLGKEIGRNGATINLLEVGADGGDWLAGPLCFLLSDAAAYVDGQVLRIGAAPVGVVAADHFAASLQGKVAVVTGAARGIGAAIAATLAANGAKVIGVDRESESAVLDAALAPIAGTSLLLDITAVDAGQRIADEVMRSHGGFDLLVNNAGVTRDFLLRSMKPQDWDLVLNINLAAVLDTTELLTASALRPGGRVVCIASIGGIGGNAGQTNYGATKAGIIGYVAALAPRLASRGMAINAVAPGFIETQMTAHMPAFPRFFGRRLASLGQGGLPEDVAQAVLFLGSPQAAGVNGRTLRVCGQNFFGA